MYLAFVKQRFDSTAGPVAKMALMLLPAATLLACVASDRRHEADQRARALALLQKLDTKFCTATGVSADWGIICIWVVVVVGSISIIISSSSSTVPA